MSYKKLLSENRGQILEKLVLGFVYIVIYLAFLVAIPPVVNSLMTSGANNAQLVQFTATIALLIQIIYLIIGIMILVFVVSPRSQPPGNYGQSGFSG